MYLYYGIYIVHGDANTSLVLNDINLLHNLTSVIFSDYLLSHILSDDGRACRLYVTFL